MAWSIVWNCETLDLFGPWQRDQLLCGWSSLRELDQQDQLYQLFSVVACSPSYYINKFLWSCALISCDLQELIIPTSFDVSFPRQIPQAGDLPSPSSALPLGTSALDALNFRSGTAKWGPRGYRYGSKMFKVGDVGGRIDRVLRNVASWVHESSRSVFAVAFSQLAAFSHSLLFSLAFLFFPTCQVRVSRFEQRCNSFSFLLLCLLFLFISSASSGCSGPCRDRNSMSPAQDAVECAWTRTHAGENARQNAR